MSDSDSPSPAYRHVLSGNNKYISGGDCALDGIAIRGFLLGTAAGLGACAVGACLFYGWFFQLPLFVTALAVFHFLEFYMTARYNTARAEIDSFLLSSNGSAYNIAHSTAMIEGVLEYYLFPSLKGNVWVMALGICLIIVGQIVRSLAMAHASTNFNHHVATSRVKGHQLVTTGVYRYWRHPSYFGFFWWGLGTQLMLGNPVSFLGYAIVLWKFFKHRTGKEEEYLLMFFGDDYSKYKKRTNTWIPFI